MRTMAGLLMLFAVAPACTRSVDDRKVYERCFVVQECDRETTEGCFLVLGATTTLGICSTHCSGDCQGGTCSDSYVKEDGGSTDPICIQSCVSDEDCPTGGFGCRGGTCLPP